MLTKQTLKKLAVARVEDAQLLLDNRRASSAYYLAGYAVEMALKAYIAGLFQPDTIPDKGLVNVIFTHKLDQLMAASGLLPRFNSACRADPNLEANWGFVTQWNEQSRYEIIDPAVATALVAAIVGEDHGVFRWLEPNW